ncbi:MAG: ATP-binding protein [Alphaproteobacteria bacterium]|nr:ATP-binding protein [Alphaproteobacteria bacterium]
MPNKADPLRNVASWMGALASADGWWAAAGPRASMRPRLGLLLAGFALATAGVLAGLMLYLRSEAIAVGGKLGVNLAQLTEESATRTLQSVAQTLEMVEGRLLTGMMKPGEPNKPINRVLRELLQDRPFLRGLWIVDAQGRTIYGTTGIGFDASQRSYFTHHRDRPEKSFWVSEPIRGSVSGDWLVPASQAVRSDTGALLAVIVAAFEPRFFARAWQLDRGQAGLTFMLVRDDGRVLMRSPYDERAMTASVAGEPSFTAMREGAGMGVFQTHSVVDGEARLMAFLRLASHPHLALVVGQSTDMVLAPWRRLAWAVAAGWAVMVAALALLGAWLARVWDARRATEDRYRMLFESNPFPMVVIDRETGRFLAVNDATVQKYGWSREEFLAMDGSAERPIASADALNAAIDASMDRPGEMTSGHRHRCKDGRFIDVDLAVRLIELDGRAAILALAHDVSERVRSEAAKRAMEEQLRQAQKMESVGQLTGGVAHDFNNLLTIILAHTESLDEYALLDPGMAARISGISGAVERASSLTRQLLAFSRKQPLRPEVTDMNDLVSGTGRLLRRALGEQIEMDSVLSVRLWPVNVDRAQLATALVNLCLNARDAMPEGGRLLLETRNVMAGDARLAGVPDIAPGDYVMLAVTDTGTGIAPDVLGKVFEPFFTTKDVGKGTGLGLSMVYGFIKQSNGHIEVRSDVDGGGTTFELYLPRSHGNPARATVAAVAAAPRGRERILLVEDNAEVRASVVGQLESLGYAVTEAADGPSGLAAFIAAAEPFDLVLTDVVMPGAMNGKVLADEIGQRAPATRIVFMSGYAENAIVHQGRIDPGVLLLGKPFHKSELASIVRQALSAAA